MTVATNECTQEHDLRGDIVFLDEAQRLDGLGFVCGGHEVGARAAMVPGAPSSAPTAVRPTKKPTTPVIVAPVTPRPTTPVIEAPVTPRPTMESTPPPTLAPAGFGIEIALVLSIVALAVAAPTLALVVRRRKARPDVTRALAPSALTQPNEAQRAVSSHDSEPDARFESRVKRMVAMSRHAQSPSTEGTLYLNSNRYA